MTPACRYNVGTTPSYLLWALLEAESELAPRALANLLEMASPAGEWAEMYDENSRPTWSYDQQAPNRLRPWEGWLALDAIYKYYARRRPHNGS